MNIILKNGSGEIEEKKSRFICHIFKIKSEEEAEEYITAVKKKYWDARHNCYAYVTGDKGQIQRFSDDGEPQGTAGKPMLDILNSYGLTDCLLVVTRYFGGVLLGTGGLIRAYQAAAKEGIKNSDIALCIFNLFYIKNRSFLLVCHLEFILDCCCNHYPLSIL